jgi:hypothetical protein
VNTRPFVCCFSLLGPASVIAQQMQVALSTDQPTPMAQSLVQYVVVPILFNRNDSR